MTEKLKPCKCSLHGMGFPGSHSQFMCEVAAEKLRHFSDVRSRWRRRNADLKAVEEGLCEYAEQLNEDEAA